MKNALAFLALSLLLPVTTQAGEMAGVSSSAVQEDGHSDVPAPPRDQFTDNACDFESWVGKPVDEAAVKATGRVYRMMGENDPATMDFNEDRLNVIYDETKTVTRVFCG